MTRAVVGLGTNLGARRALLLGAIHALAARPGLAVLARSSLYETPPLGPPQPDFLNAAVLIDWANDPRALLDELHAVERLLGRERRERWGPRTIDLDLLWWEGGEVNESALTVPHPGLMVRNFALAPLLDVLPEHEAALAPALAQLGGAPPRLRWPALEDAGDRRVVRHVADDAELVSLVFSSAFSAITDAVPLAALPFEFPAGDAEQTVRTWIDQAARSGFAASWACITDVADKGRHRGVYLGEYRTCPALPSISDFRLERGPEGLTAIIHVRERA